MPVTECKNKTVNRKCLNKIRRLIAYCCARIFAKIEYFCPQCSKLFYCISSSYLFSGNY